jgi:hydroxymethylglutaryl-CoA lyase
MMPVPLPLSQIVVHEVGLRDGLQMERQLVPTEQKAAWLEGLIRSGVDIIQVGSLVHPIKVPQMADTDALFQRFQPPGAQTAGRPVLSALVLNERGLERGLACGVELLCTGVSASETHSVKNTGKSVRESAERLIPLARRALEAGRRVQMSVQSAFGCGYEGRIPASKVLELVERFRDAGIPCISLADTAGHAVPEQVEELFGAIREMDAELELAAHFHNTYGLGLANCLVAMRSGVTYLESSVAGLGGCPFTKVAGGNVCTEDLVHYLQRIGLRTEIRLDALIEVARQMTEFFGRELPGSVHKSGPIPELRSAASEGGA